MNRISEIENDFANKSMLFSCNEFIECQELSYLVLKKIQSPWPA